MIFLWLALTFGCGEAAPTADVPPHAERTGAPAPGKPGPKKRRGGGEKPGPGPRGQGPAPTRTGKGPHPPPMAPGGGPGGPVADLRATSEAPFAGVLARLDADRDGAVREPEYPYGGAAFDAADTDGDGALGLDEVRALVLAVDPMTFDPRAMARPGAGTGPAAAAASPQLDVLRFLHAELQAARPGASTLTDADLQAAAAADLTGPAGDKVLRVFDDADFPLPVGLRPDAQGTTIEARPLSPSP